MRSVPRLVVVTFARDEMNRTSLYGAAKGLNRAENVDLLWSGKIQQNTGKNRRVLLSGPFLSHKYIKT